MSQKYTGIHMYININNLNAIIKKEEDNTDSLTRTFHSLNTYVCTIEKFAQYFSEFTTVEKFTTTRLHLYITNEKSDSHMFSAFIQVAYFSYLLAARLKDIGKYNKLAPFEIGIGADHGQFVEFVFKDKDSGIEEMTTIGRPANRAAKLQSKSRVNELLISKNLFDILPNEMRRLFFGAGEVTNSVAAKYYDLLAYRASITGLTSLLEEGFDNKSKECLRFAFELAQKNNLGDVSFSDSRVPIDYENLSLINAKKITGVMLYADIRNFTKTVDRTSLQEIEIFTERVLKGMYKSVITSDGIHVQFQGDRESAIFHEFKDRENNYIIDAIFSAMKLLDFVDEVNKSRSNSVRLDIGIGCAIGDIYTTRIGIRNNKFNIAMGETVHYADYAEDEIAGAYGHPSSEIAITKDLYDSLLSCKDAGASIIKDHFKRCGEFYVCDTRYSHIVDELTSTSITINPLAIYGCDISHIRKPNFALPKKTGFTIKAEIVGNYCNTPYKSNTGPLDKEQTIIFSPLYNVPPNCYALWQITNTGDEARADNSLRGEFERSNREWHGQNILRKESTRYKGRHLVQCFIMRDSKQCIAKSDFFIVWIK